MAIVTYTGRGDRYYVRDDAGMRHYFPRNVPVEVPDEVAALVPRSGNLTVETVPEESEMQEPRSTEEGESNREGRDHRGSAGAVSGAGG